MEELQIRYLPISDLQPYDGNPRENEKAVGAVAASILEFGFLVPVVLDRNHTIIAGHTRYKAAQHLDLQEIPCVYADGLTEEQIRAFRLADNKTAELANWDMALLEKELSEIAEINMTEFGFTEKDFEMFQEEVVEDDFNPVLPEEPKSQPGDIFQLGRHRLMCGDSTRRDDVLKLVDGQEMHLLLTDPPYNVDYEGKTVDSLKIINDNMGEAEFLQFLSKAFSAADSVMAPGAVFYIWYADREVISFRMACGNTGWEIRQGLVWTKNAFVLGRQDYHWQHEPCLYGWKGGAAHCWNSDRTQSTLLSFDRPTRNEQHPTMKPVLLFDYQIKNSTFPKGKVLDLFGGSGTTLVACEQNGRTAFVMENDPRYVDVSIARWEEFTGQKVNKV